MVGRTCLDLDYSSCPLSSSSAKYAIFEYPIPISRHATAHKRRKQPAARDPPLTMPERAGHNSNHRGCGATSCRGNSRNRPFGHAAFALEESQDCGLTWTTPRSKLRHATPALRELSAWAETSSKSPQLCPAWAVDSVVIAQKAGYKIAKSASTTNWHREEIAYLRRHPEAQTDATHAELHAHEALPINLKAARDTVLPPSSSTIHPSQRNIAEHHTMFHTMAHEQDKLKKEAHLRSRQLKKRRNLIPTRRRQAITAACSRSASSATVPNPVFENAKSVSTIWSQLKKKHNFGGPKNYERHRPEVPAWAKDEESRVVLFGR
ncbi:Uu.00g111310.m01.CDS01 [Anthostomella pinea]|uniref:Uu.00g111310.m01.CDS01 n=1 Tax=Anthostomella pinea TaxID=933095 RepID=A0AAI8VF31_9PEZI|nr:Uu.00g111310.m01.CDS01 [Anthostomella pinea]